MENPFLMPVFGSYNIQSIPILKRNLQTTIFISFPNLSFSPFSEWIYTKMHHGFHEVNHPARLSFPPVTSPYLRFLTMPCHSWPSRVRTGFAVGLLSLVLPASFWGVSGVPNRTQGFAMDATLGLSYHATFGRY